MKDNVVISLVGVNSYHISNCLGTYKYLKDAGYTVRVLTNRPDLFEPEDVFIYSNKIFTYLDKLLYCLDLIKEYNCNVLHLDADKYYSEERIKSFIEKSEQHQITYQGSWPGGNFDAYKDINPCFQYLKEYCEYRGIEYKNWKTIWEYVMFFRHDIDYNTIRYELETIAPVFTYMSLMNDDTYKKTPFALGGAEGLALSIVLDKLGIESQEVLI
jgi:hypothetical protein